MVTINLDDPNDGSEVYLEEDIFRELIENQLKKDLRFLKERFESL